MAMNYQNFASLGVNLNRQKYGPLDISNVFTSAADLKYYLSKGTYTEGVSEYWYKNANEKIVPYPYEGQVLATVIDGVVEVFVLALDTEGNFETREIAGKIEVDGTTIVKDADGKLSIVAPVDPDSSKTYNFAYANGVYSWVEVDTATAAGQAQAIAGLTDRTVALETAVNGKAAVGEEGAEGYQPAVKGLTAEVASNSAAIAANTSNITALESKIGTASKPESAEGANDATAASGIYAVIEAADNAITARIDTLETAINNETTGLEAHETRIAEVEKFFKVTGEEKISEALDTLVEIQKEIAADDASAAAMLSSINANATAIEVLNGDATKAGSVDKKIADAIAEENLSQYATTDALAGVSEDVADLENKLLTYAESDEVNAELAKKIETATIAHAVAANEAEGIVAVPEGVTKEGTALRIVIDAPTRAETTQMIADKVAQVTGGESAAAVKLLVEAETERSIAKDEAHDAALTKLNGEATVAGSVAEAKARADQGVADAAAVAADLVTANSAIADNAREIGVAKNQISIVNTTLSEKITALEGKDTTIEGNITALQTTVGGHTTTITEQGIAIAALQARDAELATLIQGNTDKFAGYYTKGEVDAAVQGAIDAIPDVDFTGYATEDYVDLAIEVVNAEVAKKADASVLENYYTKTEADAEFMTQDEVDARISGLIDAANSADTIKNVNDLVNYVNENASDIAQLISDVADHKSALETNEAAIAANAEDIAQNASDIVAINALIAANEVKESSEISVTAVEGDGATGVQLGIKEVNVNKLVQTAGDTLILNGGTAV